MSRYLVSVLLAVLPLSLGAQAEMPNPLPAFRLPITQKRPGMGTYFQVARDQSLVFFIGDKVGNWELMRVSDWDIPSPKKEKLQLKGPTGDEIEAARFGQSTLLITMTDDSQ